MKSTIGYRVYPPEVRDAKSGFGATEVITDVTMSGIAMEELSSQIRYGTLSSGSILTGIVDRKPASPRKHRVFRHDLSSDHFVVDDVGRQILEDQCMGYVRFARLLLTYRRRVYGEAWLVMATEYHALEDWMAVTLEDDSNFYNPPPWTSLAIRVRIEPPPLCRFFRTPWFFFRKDVYDKLKKTGFAKLLVFDIFDERPP